MLDDEELSATEALGILVTEPSPASGRAMKDNTPGESSSEEVKVQSHANDGDDLPHTTPHTSTLNLSLAPKQAPPNLS